MRKALIAIILTTALLAAQATKAPAPAQKAAPSAARPAAAAPAAPGAKAWDKLAYPKLGEVKLPEVKRYELANGLKLFLVEDHRLPLIDGRAMIRTGARWETPEKAGLSDIFGTVLRSGGTKTLTGDEMDEQLEGIAARVESGMDTSSGSASFSCLKGNEDKVLALFADMLMNPEFRQPKLDLAKTQARSGIARRNDSVGDIADREFNKLLYGADSPYSYSDEPEYWTVDAVTRADLVAWHAKYYHPNNTMLAVWGDFNAEEMKARLEKAFAGWKKKDNLDLPVVPQVDGGRRASLNLIRKDDVNQTNLRVGHMGGRRDDPDFYAAVVLSQIIGGGSTSRINMRIRTEMGLAYAAYGVWDAEYDHPGTFFVRVDTKSETTAKALEEILKILREIREKEVTDDELKTAKDSILNGFVFNFENTGQIVNRIMTYEYYHYPPDFLEKYKASVEKVTKADVLHAAQRLIQPDQLTVLAVGRDQDFDKPLTQLAYAGGKVNTIDIAIKEKAPGTEAAKGITDPAALQRGRQILARAVEFAGGDKLKGLKDVATEAKAKLTTPGGAFDVSIKSTSVYPSVSRQEIILPFGAVINFFDGSSGWNQSPAGTQNLNEQQKKEAMATILRTTNNLLTGYGNPTVGFEKRDGDLDVLLVTKDEVAYRVFVDAQGKIVKKTYRGAILGPPADVEEDYADFKAVDGFQLPHKLTIKSNGQPVIEAEMTSVKVNTGVDTAKLGEKPK